MNDLSQRLWERCDIDPASGCWLWKLCKDKNGYPFVSIGGKVFHAHRVAYEVFCEPIPEGLHIHQSCEVRHCINPGHLSLSHAKQTRARSVERRSHAYGEGHGNAKLGELDVRTIRRDYPSLSLAALAKRYGVHLSLIWLIVNNKAWKHVA